MRDLLYCFFLTACGVDALRVLINEPVSTVDTVLLFKTLDTGSTFLDEFVFPKLSTVSRWKEEFNIWRPNKQQMLDFFKHKPGEQIVGGSYNFANFFNKTDPIKGINSDPGYMENLIDVLGNAGNRKVLIVKLHRDLVEKWVNILRADPSQPSFACPKDKLHLDLPECRRATRIDPAFMHGRVLWDEDLNTNIDKLIAEAISSHPNVFRLETFLYDEVLSCQGVPKRINRHLGNGVDQCDRESSAQYLQEHPQRKIKDLITNLDELRQEFMGTPWQSHFADDQLCFIGEPIR